MRRLMTVLLLLPMSLFSQEVTYYKDVAPIIIDNCLECHRRGQVAPFPLQTYNDVSSKARLVQYVTQTRYMPPWIADPKYRHFENERLLTDKQIKTIQDWVKGGKKAGNKSDAPPMPQFAQNSLINRKPDLILEMKYPYELKGNNKETFSVFKFPGEIPADKEVMAIEFVPGNRRLMHHVNFYVMEIEPGVDHYKGEYGFDVEVTTSFEESLKRTNLLNKDGSVPRIVFYSGWVPGMSPMVFGDNFGFVLPKKFVILANTLHYDASPVPAKDLSKVYIFYKDKAVERSVDILMMGSGGGISEIEPELTIKPNTVARHTTKWQVPMDMSLMYCAPHMHLLGKRYEAYVITPDNKRIPILKINEWDFNWQEMYKFNPMLKIPKGSTIHVEGIFDNTPANPFNPYNPPRTIHSTGSMGTRNEMLNLMMLYLPYKNGDEKFVME